MDQNPSQVIEIRYSETENKLELSCLFSVSTFVSEHDVRESLPQHLVLAIDWFTRITTTR